MENNSISRRGGRAQWLLLLAAGALYVFSGGWYNIPFVSWLWPALLLRFVRDKKPAVGLCSAALILVIGANIKWWGIYSNGFLQDAATYSVMGIVLLLPFLADKLLAGRLRGIWSTLVFPLTWTALDYLQSISIPFGSWG